MRWIRLSERLPEPRHRYNYFVKMKTAKKEHSFPQYIYNTTCLFDGKSFVDDINVTALEYGNTVELWLDEQDQPTKEQPQDELWWQAINIIEEINTYRHEEMTIKADEKYKELKLLFTIIKQ